MSDEVKAAHDHDLKRGCTDTCPRWRQLVEIEDREEPAKTRVNADLLTVREQTRPSTVSIDPTLPGVVLVWGDGSVTYALDSDRVNPFGDTDPLLRTLMIARLRYIAARLEGDRAKAALDSFGWAQK
jgi:hypothetical protein